MNPANPHWRRRALVAALALTMSMPGASAWFAAPAAPETHDLTLAPAEGDDGTFTHGPGPLPSAASVRLLHALAPAAGGEGQSIELRALSSRPLDPADAKAGLAFFQLAPAPVEAYTLQLAPMQALPEGNVTYAFGVLPGPVRMDGGWTLERAAAPREASPIRLAFADVEGADAPGFTWSVVPAPDVAFGAEGSVVEEAERSESR